MGRSRPDRSAIVLSPAALANRNDGNPRMRLTQVAGPRHDNRQATGSARPCRRSTRRCTPTSATIPGRPWAGMLHGPAEVTGDQMVAAMDAVGVDGAVLVSPFSMYRYDASYALEVQRQHPGRFAWSSRSIRTTPRWPRRSPTGRATPGTVGDPHHDARQCLDRSGRSGHQPRARRRRAALAAGQSAVLGAAGAGRRSWRRATPTRSSSSTISGCSSRSSRRRRPTALGRPAEGAGARRATRTSRSRSAAPARCRTSRSPTGTSGTRSGASSTPSASTAACGAPTGRARSRC